MSVMSSWRIARKTSGRWTPVATSGAERQDVQAISECDLQKMASTGEAGDVQASSECGLHT